MDADLGFGDLDVTGEMETSFLDVVEDLSKISPLHSGHELEIDDKGNVWCLSCQSFFVAGEGDKARPCMWVGSVSDPREYTCRCGCPKSGHNFDNGNCLMCGSRGCGEVIPLS